MNIMIANFFNLISLHYICNTLLESKDFKKNIDKFIFLTVFAIICYININGASQQKSLIIFILYLIYILLQFKTNLFNMLCAIIPFYTFSLLSELIISVILNYFFGTNHFTSPNSLIYNFGLIISVILLLLFSYLFVKFIKYLQLNSFHVYCIFIFIFPLITIFILATLNGYYELIDNTGTMLLIFGCILLSNFSILTIFFLSMKASKISSDLKVSLYRENNIKTKYELLKNHYSTNFDFLHDLIHKCTKIQNYLDNNDMEKLKKELNLLIDNTFKRFNSIYTNSLALNYTVNAKMEELQENRINFISTIKYNDFSFIDIELQVELFSKLLDYGIMLSQSVPPKERNVIIKSQKIGNQIIISCLIKSSGMKLADNQKNLKLDLQNILYNIQNCNISVKVTKNNCMSIIICFLDVAK